MIVPYPRLSLGRPVLAALALTLCFAIGCDEESTQPEDNSLQLPALTSPESVISALQIIYNDKTHSKEERVAAYATLLDSAFVFHFQPADVNNGLPPSWGFEDEVAAHLGIFNAQSAGDIYSLELRITHNPAQDLTPPELGREGWKEVFATNVYVRLMFSLEDGLEVNGGQAEFKFPPPVGGLFRLGDWTDLPRPGLLSRAAVDGSTWGSIKAQYN